MTLSVDARRRNLEQALVSLIEALGERWFCTFYIRPSDFPHVLEDHLGGLASTRLAEGRGHE